MTPARSPLAWMDPGNGRLILAAGSGLVLLVAVPALVAPHYVWMLSALLLGFAFALFSVRRTLAILLVGTIVLPGTVLVMLVLPGGLRIQEGLILAAFGFALIDVLYLRGLRLRSSALDRAVLAFLALTLVSMAVGLIYQNSTSVILRDGRFFLYYSAFFLVTHFVDERAVLRLFLPLLLASGLVVGVEYVLEFLGAVDLSMGSRFARVGRLQGLVLPVALLFVANQFIHDPRRYGRVALACLSVPMGLALVLTVGRGMWVAFAAGLVAAVCLRHLARWGPRPRVWSTVALLVAILAFVGTTALLFQRFTGAAIGAHALERSRTFVDIQRDVHVLGRISSYMVALEEIGQRPILGSGQGKTIEVLTFNEEFMGFERTTTWTVDSLYLTLLLKMGIAGLLAFGWLYLKVLRLAFAVFRSSGDAQARAFAAGAVSVLLAMAVLGASDAAMVNGRFALVFAMIFGFVAVVGRQVPAFSGGGAPPLSSPSIPRETRWPH